MKSNKFYLFATNILKLLCSNHGSLLSQTVSEINGNDGQKTQSVSTPVYSTPPLRGFALNFFNAGWRIKTTMMSLAEGLKRLTMLAFAYAQYAVTPNFGPLHCESQRRRLK